MTEKNPVSPAGGINWKTMRWPSDGEPFELHPNALIRNPDQPQQNFSKKELYDLEGKLIRHIKGDESIGLTQVRPVTEEERKRYNIPACITHFMVGNEGFFRVIKKQRLDMVPVQEVVYECPVHKNGAAAHPPSASPIVVEAKDAKEPEEVREKPKPPPPPAKPPPDRYGLPERASDEWKVIFYLDPGSGRMTPKKVTPLQYVELMDELRLDFQEGHKPRPAYLPSREYVVEKYKLE